MPNELISADPLVAQYFFLEIAGEVVTTLSSVSGLDVEVTVATIQQVGQKGQTQMVKTLANQTAAPDISLVRMAPVDATQDKLWQWFNTVRDSGLGGARGAERKDGSIVLFNSSNTEVARFNFYNAWPSKISTDQLSADSNDVVKETITLTCERLERKK